MDVKQLKLLNKELSMNQEEYQKKYQEYASQREKVKQDPWRLHYHLMPETGWVNDPNGLCQFKGTYHIYYQYSPFDVEGQTKLWGHMTSSDLIHFKQGEPVLFPDSRVDERGVYSGSAFIKDDTIHYFYTGNVKLIDKEYDYIYAGREQNLVHVESQDGYHFSDKEWLLNQSDYPQEMSCHIRDPKIYEKDDRYYMVLGARSMDDQGCVLIYEGTDLKDWQYKMCITTNEPFGYMWECPDLFDLDHQQFLLTCPQGLPHVGYRYENVYQSGYFPIEIDFKNQTYTLKDFKELDYGFDFYAPQTFEDEQGRRILIGWMGLPDIDYTNPTCERGWQHALTMPRVLTQQNGIIHQSPVEEMKALRQSHTQTTVSNFNDCHLNGYVFEMRLAIQKSDDFILQLRKGAYLKYDQSLKLLTLAFEECGYGREERHIELETINNIWIYSDTSALEIYINDGSYVLTSRVYSLENEDNIQFIKSHMEATIDFYKLSSIIVK